MTDVAEVEQALAGLKVAYNADGYELLVDAVADGTARVHIVPGPNASQECLVPKPHRRGHDQVIAALGPGDQSTNPPSRRFTVIGRRVRAASTAAGRASRSRRVAGRAGPDGTERATQAASDQATVVFLRAQVDRIERILFGGPVFKTEPNP